MISKRAILEARVSVLFERSKEGRRRRAGINGCLKPREVVSW